MQQIQKNTEKYRKYRTTHTPDNGGLEPYLSINNRGIGVNNTRGDLVYLNFLNFF